MLDLVMLTVVGFELVESEQEDNAAKENTVMTDAMRIRIVRICDKIEHPVNARIIPI